jgi:hypothetical protein
MDNQLFKIEVGIRQLGYLSFESSTYPEFSEGMIFILDTSGKQIVLSLREVMGVITTPVEKEKE